MILCSAEPRIISCLPTHVINFVINDNSLEIIYIYILPEIYFTNLYRFPETENLLYIDLKTCQYHSVHFRYNLYKLVKYISGNMYITRLFSTE